MKCRFMARNNSAIGSVITTDVAITAPQIGRVLTEEPAEKQNARMNS